MKAIFVTFVALGILALTQSREPKSGSVEKPQRQFFTKGSFVTPIHHVRQDNVFEMVEAAVNIENADLVDPAFVFMNVTDTNVTAGAFLLRLYKGDRIFHEVQQSFDSKLLPESQAVPPSGIMTADFSSIQDKFGGNITRVEIVTDFVELADGSIQGPNTKRIDRQIAAARQGARAMLNYLKQKYTSGGTRAVENALNVK